MHEKKSVIMVGLIPKTKSWFLFRHICEKLTQPPVVAKKNFTFHRSVSEIFWFRVDYKGNCHTISTTKTAATLYAVLLVFFSAGTHKGTTALNADTEFPYGILIVVSIGVALGVFFGGLLLSVAVMYMRR